MSNRKCLGGAPQTLIDPNTGLPLPQGAGQITMPPKQVNAPLQTPQQQQQRPISTDASKQAFSPATQQQASIQAGMVQQQNILQQQQQLVEQAKQIQASAMAVAVSECAAGRGKAMTTDAESLKAAFGKMTETMKTRRYKFGTTFTMRRAAVQGVTIGVSKENKHIFQLKNPEGGARIGMPETAILLGARLLSAYSDCRAEVGVKMAGAKGNTYVPAGGRFVFTVDYKENLSFGKEGLVIHQVSEVLDVRRLERYGHLTMEDILKTIFPVKGLGISFVTVNSPIVYVVEKNKETLHIPVESFQPIESQYHLIADDIIQYVLQEIDKSFFKKMPFTDLTNFHLKLERTDGRKWDSPVGVESYSSGASGDQQAGTYFLTKPNRFRAWIELDFALTNISRFGGGGGGGATAVAVASGEGAVAVAEARSQLNGGGGSGASTGAPLTTGF
jgi:hypothetical protein